MNLRNDGKVGRVQSKFCFVGKLVCGDGFLWFYRAKILRWIFRCGFVFAGYGMIFSSRRIWWSLARLDSRLRALQKCCARVWR